jgi:hypothetical protein
MYILYIRSLQGHRNCLIVASIDIAARSLVLWLLRTLMYNGKWHIVYSTPQRSMH